MLSTRGANTLWLLLAVVLGALLWQSTHALLNHDSAWIIYGTTVQLDGGRLYKDVFELNSPLIFWMTVPPVWYAKLFDISNILAFQWYVALLIAASVSAIWKLQIAMGVWQKRAAIVCFMFALVFYVAGDFGQREHLLLVFALPYLVLQAVRARGGSCNSWFAAIIGIWAVFGFALKPYFLIVPVMVEGYVVWRRGTIRQMLRADTIALATGGLIYAGCILAFTPEYLSTIVPYGMAMYAAGFEYHLAGVLAVPASLILPLSLLLHGLRRNQQSMPELGDTLGIAAICLYGVYILQMKGWRYQSYPASALSWILLALVCASEIRIAMGASRRVEGGILGAFAIIGSGSISLLAGALACAHQYQNASFDRMMPLVAKLPRGAPVYVFTTKVSDAFPLMNYSGARWASRFDTLWLLPGLLLPPPTDRGIEIRQDIEHFLRGALVADFNKFRPALVFAATGPRIAYIDDPTFDFIQYFSSDPAFAAIWALYEPAGEIPGFHVFRRRQKEAS